MGLMYRCDRTPCPCGDPKYPAACYCIGAPVWLDDGTFEFKCSTCGEAMQKRPERVT